MVCDRILPSDCRVCDRLKDRLTKNDHYLAMLDAARRRGFRPRAVLFDSRYSGLECVKQLRRALASPRGRGVTGGLIRRSLARAWEWSAEGAARERRPRAIGWYLRAAWYRPWGLGPYKGIIKCCLGRV